MKICAVIQSRIMSTRLPKKVLKEIMEKPMLWYLINQELKRNIEYKNAVRLRKGE